MLLTGFVLIVLTLSIGVDIVSLEPAQGLITFSLIRTEVSVGQLKDGVAIDAGFGLLPHRLAPKGMEIIHLQVTASA